MPDSWKDWLRFHRLRVVCALAGGILFPATGFRSGGASVPWFTDIEARISYAALAVFVYALAGALAGWAIGALIGWVMRSRK